MSKLEQGEGGLLIYRNALLILTILGGVKLEGLDRLRVTIKIEVPDSPRPPIRHNLDLYNDNQLGKLVRLIAARLEVGMSVTEACLAELIEALEAWRLEEIKRQQGVEDQVKPLTEEETARGMAELTAPDLSQRIAQLLAQSGIIGEEGNAQVLYRCMVSSAHSEPLSAISIARSGTGKSYLMEKVAACFPEESKMECTQLTPNSLYYMGRHELSHRIMLIEDLEGARDVMYPLRELQSKKRITKTATAKRRDGSTRSERRVVEGPIALIACTTADEVYEDNANRSIMLYLDGSTAQDARIAQHLGAQRSGTQRSEEERIAQELLRIMYRLLRPVKVINPWAPLIVLPKEVAKPRRTLGLLLNFIEVGAFLHQYQRTERVDEGTGEVCIEASIADVEEGFALLKETLFRKADELTGECRATLEWIRANVQGSFTAHSIRKAMALKPRTLRHYLHELADYGYLDRDTKKKHSTGHIYTLPKDAGAALPQSIEEHIAQVIANVKAAQVGKLARVGNEAPCQPTGLIDSEKKQVGKTARKRLPPNEEAAPAQ